MDSLLRVSEEASIPLKDLLELVQQVENGASAAFLARYRADLCAGIDEDGIHRLLRKLEDLKDLIDRRISMMAMLGQRGVMSAELKKQLEEAADRRALNDVYLPYRDRKPGAAEEAVDKGLDPLARTLWLQQQDVDLAAEVSKHVNQENGVESDAQALEGAYAIAAQWLSDKPEIHQALRKIYLRDCEIAVTAKPAVAKAPRLQALDGFRAKVGSVDWKKRLTIRRGQRSGLLETQLVPPYDAATRFLERRLIQDTESPYAPHLRQVVAVALGNGLADRVKHNIQAQLDEQADTQAIESYSKALRSALLAPPAFGLNILGIEIARSGEWHAALISGEGQLVKCAIVRSDGKAPERKRETVRQQSKQGAEPAAAAEQVATPGSTDDPQSTAPATAAVAMNAGEATTPESTPHTGEATTPVRTADADVSASAESATDADTRISAESVPEGPPESGVPATEEPPNQPDPRAPAAQAADARPAVQNRNRTERIELSEFLATNDVDLLVYSASQKPHIADEYVRSQIRKSGKISLPWRALRDSGARIYSRTPMAKRTYRRLPTTFVTAAAMARRIQDPMAELAKADFRSAGIGLNYLEVNADLLREAFQRTLECVTHEVGVDPNQASISLLSLVPGFTDRLAKRVVGHRKIHGPYGSREDLRKVDGVTARIFAQAVGFLRVSGADPLDSTGAHPEYRQLYESIAEAAGCDLGTLLNEPERLDGIDPEQFASPERSVLLVKSAIKDLMPERRLTRGTFELPKRAVPLRSEDELLPGTKILGVVSNTADFGAFVDIGANQDGFLHVSQIGRELLVDSKPSFQSGDTLEVFIRPPLEGNRRIGLSMRAPGHAPSRDGAGARRPGPDRRGNDQRGRGSRSSNRYDRDKPFRQVFGPSTERRGKNGRKQEKLSLTEKLDMLSDKYRTKV